MDQNLDELQLFSNDIVKDEVVDSEECQKRLAAGKDDKWLVKEEVIEAPSVKEDVEDGEIWGYGGYFPREDPDLVKNPEAKKKRLTPGVDAKRYVTQKGLNAEVKEEAESFPSVVEDAVQPESGQIYDRLQIAQEEPDGSFNVHDLFSNEAAVKEEGEESQNAADERKSCPVDGCFEKFPSLPDLVKHMKTHPKPLICGVCKRSFAHPSVLRQHYVTHTGEKNFECHPCDYKAALPSNLKMHLRTHTMEKPYACSFCDKSFATSSNLTKHVRTHSFVCAICGFSTSLRYNLTLHIRAHTGETPYPCNTCDKRFKSSGDLVRHNRIHAGDKSYSCDICEFQTAHLPNLKAHQKALHKMAISH